MKNQKVYCFRLCIVFSTFKSESDFWQHFFRQHHFITTNLILEMASQYAEQGTPISQVKATLRLGFVSKQTSY